MRSARTAAAAFMVAAVAMTAAGCAAGPGGDTSLVGVAMPTTTSLRWVDDGNDVKQQLENPGYEVDLRYAENDVAVQVQQVGATFDNHAVGVLQAQSLVRGLGLEDADGNAVAGAGPFAVELFAGSSDDNNATVFYEGAMGVLEPYIASGDLVVTSGETDFDTISIAAGDQTSTIYKNTQLLAEVAVSMGHALLTGREPETNDMTRYDNGVKVVPTMLLTPQLVTQDNLERVLVESGAFTAEEIR